MRGYYLLIGLLLFNTLALTVNAQPVITAKESNKLVEKTTLLTDREIYCVNENILFSAFNGSSLLKNENWSHVLYVELITPDGEAIAKGKYFYDQDGTAGALKIPDWVLTGNYYLRAYTRWMRDYSPYNYFYKMITVINPFKPELLSPQGEDVITVDALKDSSQQTGNFKIEMNKDLYHKRENIHLKISNNNRLDLSGNFSLSVIPKGAERFLKVDLPHNNESSFSQDFIPETRGLSISGKVVNQKDSLPMQFTLVGLTIFKENPVNRNILTNEKGQFFFNLAKLRGKNELFISADANDKQEPLILVDNDFSTQEVHLPFVSMDLLDQSKEVYRSLMFTSQIHNLYQKEKEKEATHQSFLSDSTFYGKPDFVLKIDDYIPLPTIKDFIYELVPKVGVRQIKGKTRLKVLGDHSELSIYDPLVLIDMVPIFDVDKVLALAPSKIDRIEVVATPYVRGNIIFGGIVSLFSKKGDLAGIDLPSTGRFISYSMLNPNWNPVSHDIKNEHIPNLWNCLYWKPRLDFQGAKPIDISFSAGDNFGSFVVSIQGFDKNGNPFITTKDFEIQ